MLSIPDDALGCTVPFGRCSLQLVRCSRSQFESTQLRTREWSSACVSCSAPTVLHVSECGDPVASGIVAAAAMLMPNAIYVGSGSEKARAGLLGEQTRVLARCEC